MLQKMLVGFWFGCVLWLLPLWLGHSPLQAQSRVETPQRPVLAVQQGRYFRYAMPQGWQANETRNGVDMIAPDRVTTASFALLVGGYGQPSPAEFLQMMLASSPDFQDVRLRNSRSLPGYAAGGGMQWQIAEVELSYQFRGVFTHAHYTVGVLPQWGQYSAFVRGYQAPESDWSKARYWLPAIAETVVITNAREVAGQQQIKLPGPISHDYIYGDYQQAWEKRQQSLDSVARDQHEATMGYERSYDPQTGRYYNMPYEQYDSTLGGYRNPQRPDELLERAPLD